MAAMTKRQKLWATSALGLILAGIFIGFWREAAMRAGRSMLDFAQDRWSTMKDGDRLDRESRNLAGPSAIDCGRARLEGAMEVNACVLAATNKGRPFRARYVVLAIDARVERALVRAEDGRGYEITFMEGPYVPAESRLSIDECPQPLKLRTTEQALLGGDPITCLADH